MSDGVAMLLSTKLHLNTIPLTFVAFGVMLLNELAFTVYGPADGYVPAVNPRIGPIEPAEAKVKNGVVETVGRPFPPVADQ